MAERFAVVGNSGSGKSTLAKHLSAAGAVAVLDLDTVAWEPHAPTTLRATAEAARAVKAFCRTHKSWVVEGCYAGLIEATFEFNPELIFLDPGLESCLTNCRARPWEPHKYASKAEQDQNLAFLLDWVADYYQLSDDLSLKAHRRLFSQYTGAKTHLTELAALPG